jgi:hypothetical protein
MSIRLGTPKDLFFIDIAFAFNNYGAEDHKGAYEELVNPGNGTDFSFRFCCVSWFIKILRAVLL